MTTYVSATNHRSATAGATTQSDNFNHTFGSASNRCAVVEVFVGDADNTVDTVTVGGVSASLVRREAGVSHAVEMWALANPATGSQAVVVTMQAAASYEYWITCIELSDVDQTTPVRTSSATGATGASSPDTLTLDVSSAPGDLVIDAYSINATETSTVGADQTEIRQTNTSDGQRSSYEAGAASVTMSWTGITVGRQYAHVAASFQSPTSSSETTVTPSQATLTTEGRAPLINDFTAIVLRGTLINEAGSPLADLTGISCLVWYGSAPAGAPDESLSSLTTNSNGSYSFALALGGLAFQDPVYRVIYLNDPPTRNQAGRRVPDYE